MKRIISIQGLLGLCFGLIVCLQFSNGSTENQQIIVKVDHVLCADGVDWDQEVNRCRPICRPKCESNEVCIWRNTCRCKIGYSKENGVCKPICSQGCEHGNCTAPEKCDCNEGYFWDWKILKCQPNCEPKCDQHAFCSAPHICTCHNGYKKVNGVCQPICSHGCEHGTCKAPEKCICDKGYLLDQKTQKCKPNCEPKCDQHADCSAPNICTCHKGYVEGKGVCQPICSQGCEHGICIAPEKCICDKGYLLDQKTQKCKPNCEPKCDQHADCSAPNICTCHKGYVEEKGVCQPICSQGCEHGTCIAPEKCDCNKGYLWDQKTQKCQPTCNPKCKENAFCSAPNVCTCLKGYKEVKGVCQPICSHGCEHGTCIAPEKCICEKGYKWEPKILKCEPVCTHECGFHGRCVAPDKCDCSTGYEWDEKTFTCLPKCVPKCGSHSFCHKSNECKCLHGYKPDDIHSLSCSLPLQWWIYLLIGFLTVLIISSVVVIIYYFVARSRNVSYYPNSNFSDTTQIIN